MMKALIHSNNKTMEELKSVTMANSRDIQELKSYTTQAVNSPASQSSEGKRKREALESTCA
jgi:hypothetical protein